MEFSVRGLNLMALVVKDINIARGWFVDTLGLQLVEDRWELLFIAAGKDILAIKTPAVTFSF